MSLLFPRYDVLIRSSLKSRLSKKRDYLIQHQADVLVMGDDWAGRFDEFADICQVVYLPRTPSISTTTIIERIRL